jgi:hypothetical protein
LKKEEKVFKDEKALFDNPNVIIIEEVDPTEDLFYSLVG